MSEMTERMARAAYEVDPVLLVGANGEPTHQEVHWDNLDAEFKANLIKAQSAALAAAREPTEAMKMAMFEQGQISLDGYRCAIDAALK